MRVFLTTIAIVLVTLTSCQKDYYLNDLTDAQAEIERLESLNMQKQRTIAELEDKIATDEQTIAQLNSQIDSALLSIDNLTEVRDGLTEELAETRFLLEQEKAIVRDLSDELAELNEVRNQLVAELNASTEENTDLNNRIDNLNAQVNSIERDLERRTGELETIIAELTETIDEMNEDTMSIALVPVETPEGRTGLWFVVDNMPNGLVQVYTRNNEARYAAFNNNIQHLKAAQGGARTLQSALDALATIN